MHFAILCTVHSVLDVRVFYKQSVSLAAAGYDITLIGPRNPEAIQPIKDAGITYIPLRASGSRINRVRQWARLFSVLRASNYDAWHFHDPELLILMILFKAILGKKAILIYDIHEDVPKDILDKSWILPWLRKSISSVVDIMEGWGIRRCDQIIASTESIGRRAGRFSRRVTVVHNYPKALLPNGSAKNERSSTVQIIYAGNITPIRGLREVVQAMKLVTDCDVVLNLVGLIYPDDFQQEIRILAGPNVILYGKMPFEESQQLVRCSDIGVVTFHPLANHVEALPNKLFEYMQNGLPVIASDFPIWKNIIEQVGCGIAVDPLKPEEIAAAIRKLANDPALRHEMGEAGIKAVKQKYSWEREQNILLQLYRELSACPDKTAY